MAVGRRVIQRAVPAQLSTVQEHALSPEIFRQIIVSLDLAPNVTPILGVASAIRGEGRTTVARGLAECLAGDMDAHVVLADLDFGRDDLAYHFNIPPSPGLGHVLTNRARIEDVMSSLSPYMSVVPGGGTEAEMPRLLRQVSLLNPFHELRESSRAVVLDLPPLLNHGYSALAASVVDALILVVRATVTPAELVREAITRLEGMPPHGIVFNGAQSALPHWWPGRPR